MANRYVSIREYEAGNKGLHEKLDLILHYQEKYIEDHRDVHKTIDKNVDDFKAMKNKIIGGAVTANIIVIMLWELVRGFFL